MAGYKRHRPEKRNKMVNAVCPMFTVALEAADAC
jgi:hypothetical protein